jgi:hypothetical protein
VPVPPNSSGDALPDSAIAIASVESGNTTGQLFLTIGGKNSRLEVPDHISSYLPHEFPENTIINSGEFNSSVLKSAKIVFSDSAKYLVEFNTQNSSYITVHNWNGIQTGLATIFDINTDKPFTHFDYAIITPVDIRVHMWNYKEDFSDNASGLSDIKNEKILHFNIGKEGGIGKVDRPENIVDYFSILPAKYISHHV